MYSDAWVFDIQLALNNTKLLDLLRKLKECKRELLLMEKRSEKDLKLRKKLNKKIWEIKTAEDEIKKYKEASQELHIVKGFVTFNSVEAAMYIKRTYNISCIRRWKSICVEYNYSS